MGMLPSIDLLGVVWSALMIYLALRLSAYPAWATADDQQDMAERASPCVLVTSALALLLAVFATAHGEFSSGVGQGIVLTCLLVAGVIATWVEWLLVKSGGLSPWLFKLLVVITVGAFGLVFWPGIAETLLSFRLVIAVIGSARSYEHRNSISTFFTSHPARLVILTFAALSLVGGLLLSLPAAQVSYEPTPLIDALFTSTSACCVTGLVALDTATHWSGFGQAVILILIQVGAFGIMTISALATLLIVGSLPGRTEGVLEEVVGGTSRKSTFSLMRTIMIATLAVEGLGALILIPAFMNQGDAFPTALWNSVFHSISAFCNAGFSTRSDSLMSFQGTPWVLHVFAILILLGGLGFGVMLGLREYWIRSQRRLPLQVKLVFWSNAVLLGVGFLSWLALEWDGSLATGSVADRIHNGWFQTVTLRTAGFNTVDMGGLSPGILMLSVLWMFIGANPGSTGGGIKTTTVAVLFLAVVSVMRGRPDAEAAGRCVPKSVVYRAAAVLTISAGILFLGTLALMASQSFENATFERLLFESTSAFGTVGLSTGITPSFDRLGKLILMALMFIGRTGPLTMALLFRGRHVAPVQYPEEEVMVG